MATSENNVIVGVFEDRSAVVSAVDELVKKGVHQDQIGFIARHEGAQVVHEHLQQGDQHSGPGSIMRGIVGGIMGAVDMLLMPVTGPADASTILATTLPATENIMDRWTNRKHPEELQTPELRRELEPGERIRLMEQSEEEREQHERRSAITGSVVGGVVGTSIATLLIPGIGPVLAGGLLAAAFGGVALGGVAGNFLGAFVDLGIPRHRADQYGHEVEAGRTVLTVQAPKLQRMMIEETLHRYGAIDVETH